MRQLSRRAILASLGGIGVAGAVSGGGTAALFTDRSEFGGQILAGNVVLDVNCDSCVADGDALSFAFAGIDRGERGVETLQLAVETNPARVWLRTQCPSTIDPLGEALVVSLSAAGSVLASGSLSDVRRDLHAGVRLDSDCLEPGDRIELSLEWALPNGTPDSVAGSMTSVSFSLFAEQCRHVGDATATNPYVGAVPCEEGGCPACELLGKFEFDGGTQRFEVGERYPLDTPEGSYYLAVTDVENDGNESTCVAFELDRTDGPTPPMCRVDIGSGRNCRPGAPSRGGSPNGKRYEFEPPRNDTGGTLCTRTFEEIDAGCDEQGGPSGPPGPPGNNGPSNQDNATSDDGRQPAISNVAVYVCVSDDDSDDSADASADGDLAEGQSDPSIEGQPDDSGEGQSESDGAAESNTPTDNAGTEDESDDKEPADSEN